MSNFNNRNTVLIFRLLLIIATLFLITAVLIINCSTYESALAFFKPSLLAERYEQRISYEKDLFNYNRFLDLKKLIVLIAFMGTLVSVIVWIKAKTLIHSFTLFLNNIRTKAFNAFSPLKHFSRFQWIILFALIAAIISFHIYLLNLMIEHGRTFDADQSVFDERFSYSYFVSQGIIPITTYYPDTNNHILYNLTCWVFSFADSSSLCMKIPSFIFNIILLITIFIVINKLWGFNEAILSLSICGIIYSSSIYALIGRGYMMLSLFTFIAFISIYKYLIEGGNIYLTIF